jgi:hypothetical protein
MEDDRDERIVKAVLHDMFVHAAMDYASELHANSTALEVSSITRLMRLREAFLTSYLMQSA